MPFINISDSYACAARIGKPVYDVHVSLYAEPDPSLI